MKALLKRSVRLDAVILLCVVFVVIGFFLQVFVKHRHTDDVASEESSSEMYVCPMNISYHPYFSSTDPDEKCGYCGMDLVAAADDESGGGDRVLVMSEAAMKLAEITVAPVEKRFVDIEVPMAGKIDFDETRVKTISAWVDGRLDRLFVDYTGIPVKQGDHLVEIYSPALYSAQEELLQAVKTAESLSERPDGRVAKTAVRTVDAAREKLKLLGLSEVQIASLEENKKATARMEIKSPIGGIVIHKNAKEGMYVKTGTPIYTVADMSKLWVQLDAYESDLPWLKYGQKVNVFTEAFGDRVFKGWISFIDPVLDSMTRTVKVRVLVDNDDGLLKPNMLVRAVVRARAGSKGVILPEGLSGTWMCPMHPEVVNIGEGSCDVCGMDLVPASELGYVKSEDSSALLVIPASAVLITGKRSIVYVRKEDSEKPSFEGVEIELGPRAGDDYVVRSGLKVGQMVVLNGSFKIDSALQLHAKPSMMSPGGGDMPSHSGHQMKTMETTDSEKSSHNMKELKHQETDVQPQTLCPIMGGAINKDEYVDHGGYRIYFCCGGCEKTFMKDPDGYIAKMQAEGIQLDKTPQPMRDDHAGH